ncbi:MAG: adenylate/guanylate cyclase domain-containing protein [Pseudomonadota bacterium]
MAPTKNDGDGRLDLDALESGERRQISALFYDIVGSTSLLSSMDPEDFRAVQQEIHSAASAIIEDHNGYLDLLMGDGGTAYFGYIAPDEDAPANAVRTGLKLLDAIKDLETEDGDPVRIRIGIATAPAVFGPSGTGALASREGIVGVAPTMAARIEASANPASVFVSRATYLATDKMFEYESRGLFPLKGFDTDQELFEALKETPRFNRLAGFRSQGLPLVARGAELNQSLKLWKKAVNRDGQMLYFSGDPGIGKSRLAKELRDRISDAGYTPRIFQCEPQGQSVPFFPILEGLRREVRRTTPDFDFSNISPTALSEALGLPSKGIDPLLYEVLAYLMAPEGTFPQPELPPDKGDLADWSIRVLISFPIALALKQPTAIFLEDAHWADSRTWDLLDAVFRSIPQIPVLFVITSRDRCPDDWLDADHMTAIGLSSLERTDISALISSISGDRDVPDAFVDAVMQKSDGVPLFAEQLTRFLLERDAPLPKSDAEWAVVFEAPETANLQDLLTSRLASLGSIKTLAQTAAVIGRVFTIGLLASLIAPSADQSQRIENDLNRIVDAGFLTEQGPGEFAFRHALIQQASYESLLKSNRAVIHRTVLNAIEDNPTIAPGTSDAELAYHAENAREFERAITFYVSAGATASQQSGLAEARDLLTRAQKLLKRIKDKEKQALLSLEIMASLGPVLTTLEGPGSKAAASLYAAGVDLCRTKPEITASEWFPIFWGWWFTAQNFKEQRLRSVEILELIGENAEGDPYLQAQHCRWATAFNTGNHQDCLDAIESGLKGYDPDLALNDRIRFGGHDARVCGLGERGLSAWFMGKTETALVDIARARAWADEIEHLGSTCHVLDFQIMLHTYRKEPQIVVTVAREMARIAEEHDLTPMKAKSLIFKGWADGIMGDAKAGKAGLQEGLAIQAEIGTSEDFPVYYEMLGSLDERLEDFQEGLSDLRAAAERAKNDGHEFWLPELLRRSARLSAAAGEPAEIGKALLQEAIDLAERQGAIVLNLRSRTEHLRLFGVTHDGGSVDQIFNDLNAIEPGSERAHLENNLRTAIRDA